MKNILVVDNHPVILKFMSNLLEKAGHQVVTAKDGLSALEILGSYIPDVAFIDLIMPNIDGKKLCNIIRGMENMKDVCLIVLSGIVAEEKIDYASFEADGCIAKGPFSKMGANVLSALDILEKGSAADLPNEILGSENIYERAITKELLSLKKHSDLIFNNMEEGIIELTSDGKIVYVNPACISVIGVPERYLLGSNFLDLFSNTQSAMINDLLKTKGMSTLSMFEESPLFINFKLVSLDILHLNEENRQTIVVILHDITERKQAEKEKSEVGKKLQQIQKMASIATLAGGIAHQFNNALATVIGSTELLQINLSGDKTSEEHLKSIINSSKRMVALTNRLLAYARGGKYQKKVVSVQATLSLISQIVDPSIRLSTDLPDDILNIEADLTQLQMLLSSVLSNSSEAIGKDGHIRLSAKSVNIDDAFVSSHPEFKKGTYACLTVEDDGKGMDKETLGKIFDPFYTTKFLGRGLGMAAVYGIVENHGGSILIESELDIGTKVSIYLPAVEAEIKKTKESAKAPSTTPGTVLLIEDDEIVVDVNQMLLERMGYQVLVAKTGEESIDIANTFERDIDIAILDIVLPDMGGKAAYPLLTKARPNMKVVVCSGYSIDGPAQEILNAGAQGFIQKPFTLKKLSEKLDEVLDRASLTG